MFLAQLVGPRGKICAMEASPKHALTAQAQVGLNKLEERVTILNAAASDRARSLYFQREHIATSQNAEAIEIQCIRGDDLLKSFGSFDVLKIDVEGYEEITLRGCEAILRSKPKLALEIHFDLLSRYGSSVSSLLDLISVGNYHGTMMVRPGWHTLHDFSVETLPSTGVVNLFLEHAEY